MLRNQFSYSSAAVLVLAAGIGMPSHTNAQLAANSSNDPIALVNELLSVVGGATVSNEELTGATGCAGTFMGGLSVDGGVDFQVDSGVILSSGLVTSVAAPNSADNTTTSFNTAGDPQLDQIVAPFGTTTFDACALEFDFECPAGSQGSEVSFRYNFTSEEYNEFTNSAFTNVFAFFLNGQNIALLPDGVTPVQINTVNGGRPTECINGADDDSDTLIDAADPDCTTPGDNIVGENNSNSAFYVNNDCSDPDGGAACPKGIEADGYTTTLTAAGPANQVPNTIKLAIADAGDRILDSWVLIEGGSFECTVVIKTDVKPQSNPNCINPDSRGVISVAFFGSDDFDVGDIDQGTLTWGGADPVRCAFEDAFMENLDGTFAQDGITDLVCKFRTSEVVDLPQSGDDCAVVEAEGFLLDGTAWNGSDLVCVPGDPSCERS